MILWKIFVYVVRMKYELVYVLNLSSTILDEQSLCRMRVTVADVLSTVKS